jgi:trans-aconitate methyltransferase
MTAPARYTFGDSSLAAQRLARLAEAYGPTSRAFVAQLALPPPARAVDLGCGPGYSTRMLDETLRPQHTLGLDSSAAFVDAARKSSPAHLTFAQHDVRVAPFPGEPPDFLYARFLVTHLAGPCEVLAAWHAASADGAVAAIEETAAMRSEDPIFVEYYELVARMQAAHGQALDIGRTLHTLAAEAGWRVLARAVDTVILDGTTMARLHAMNIATWKHDARAQALFAPEAIERVERALGEVAAGVRAAPPVTTAMARVVLSK